MFLDKIVDAKNRGESLGTASICSAHPWVLRASMKFAAQRNVPLLIEATCNQVNQLGGYTGMTPAAFVSYVHNMALENNFPGDQIVLGGDHLGPNVWQHEPANIAMEKSEALVQAYVRAGFEKIHLDASMRLADDPPGPLAPKVVAQRAAILARTAETALSVGQPAPRYVIGTEVPVPGGAAHEEDHFGEEESVSVTTVESARETIEITHAAFQQEQVEAAWERVMAVVVQPGVEFGDDFVLEYQPEAALGLTRFIETQPGLIYEAHSTDYQTKQALQSLVRDHYGILKVGPALTFAFREAVFAMALMENELFPPNVRSNVIDVLEAVMVRKPEYWQKYYAGTQDAQAFKRKYSLSDRSRYYWAQPEMQAALHRMLENLKHPLPAALLMQFLPIQYQRIRRGHLENTAAALIEDKIRAVLEDYAFSAIEGEAKD